MEKLQQVNKEVPLVGLVVLTRFLIGYSVSDLAEEYGCNCLLIEESIRNTVEKLSKLITVSDLAKTEE